MPLRPLLCLFAASLLGGCWLAPKQGVLPEFDSPSFGEEAWSHWGDGKAELASYDLVHPHTERPARDGGGDLCDRDARPRPTRQVGSIKAWR